MKPPVPVGTSVRVSTPTPSVTVTPGSYMYSKADKRLFFSEFLISSWLPGSVLSIKHIGTFKDKQKRHFFCCLYLAEVLSN